jgi:hypothetical protein
METERDGHLPFLDIKIYRRPDGSLDHKVYWKPTHNNLYLNPESRHHPSNIQVILSTLVYRDKALCDKESLHDDLELPKTIFRENGYSIKQIQWALNLAVKTSKLKEAHLSWSSFICSDDIWQAQQNAGQTQH